MRQTFSTIGSPQAMPMSFCMIVPQARGDLESYEPRVRPLATEPETLEATKAWDASRREAQTKRVLDYHRGRETPGHEAWEKDYYRGARPDGSVFEDHVTRRELAPFEEG